MPSIRLAFFSSILGLIPLSSAIPGLSYLLQMPAIVFIYAISGYRFAALYLAVYFGYNFQSAIQTFYLIHSIIPKAPVFAIMFGTVLSYVFSTILFLGMAKVLISHPQFAGKRLRRFLYTLVSLKHRWA